MTSNETRGSESYWQSDVSGEIAVPVARPRLPTADEIAPYLQRIDESRWYSNNGPLVQEFEERLASHFGGESDKSGDGCQRHDWSDRRTPRP